MDILQEARMLRVIIEQAVESLDDKIASSAPPLFGKLKYDGSLIHAGTRINWNGAIKKATVDLWDTAENAPDVATTLWEDIEYKDGIRIIPGTITVTSMFGLNELGWWNGKVYKSLIANNVYTPDQYPQGWEVQT